MKIDCDNNKCPKFDNNKCNILLCRNWQEIDFKKMQVREYHNGLLTKIYDLRVEITKSLTNLNENVLSECSLLKNFNLTKIDTKKLAECYKICSKICSECKYQLIDCDCSKTGGKNCYYPINWINNLRCYKECPFKSRCESEQKRTIIEVEK